MDRECCVFRREYDGPVLVSALLVEPAGRSAYRFVAVHVALFDQERNGLPTRGELERLHKLRDGIEKVLATYGTVTAGHRMANGRARLISYCRAKPPISISVKTGLFKSESLALDVRDDPDWELYRSEIEPTPLEFEEARSWMLLQKLKEAGDRPEAPREVDFAATFPSDSGRRAFMEEQFALGYHLGEEGTWEDNHGGCWCVISRDTSVELGVICQLTAALRESARRHGGDLDGWQTPVIT